ncbi:MAG: hypothetical protein QXK31_03740 [Fervidicoccaceae archaeon]
MTCNSKKIALVHSSIRSCLAEILLSRGLSASKAGRLLRISGSAVMYYRKGSRGGLLKKSIMENPKYRKALEEIADLLIEDDEKGVLYPLIEESICRLCKDVRKNVLVED